jgi:hypothetical protein
MLEFFTPDQGNAIPISAVSAATLPGSTTIQPGHYYLVVGPGFTASAYAGPPVPDTTAGGSLLAGGGAETIALLTSSGSCSGSSNVVDTVVYNLRRKVGADFIHTRRGLGYVVEVQ